MIHADINSFTASQERLESLSHLSEFSLVLAAITFPYDVGNHKRSLRIARVAEWQTRRT